MRSRSRFVIRFISERWRFSAPSSGRSLTSKEYPPADEESFRLMKKQSRGIGATAREIVTALKEMPSTMKQLAFVQLSTWLGLFCMWLYFTPAVPITSSARPIRNRLSTRRATSGPALLHDRKRRHVFLRLHSSWASDQYESASCPFTLLLCGAAGLISVGFIHGIENRIWLMSR